MLVKEGMNIKESQLIGLCGNSGNSSEPHLHLHIMDTETLEEATGIKCYFTKLKVNGTYRKKYSPVRSEKVSR